MKSAVIGYGKVAKAIIDNFDIDCCLVRDLSKFDNRNIEIKTDKIKYTDNYKDLAGYDLYIIAVTDSAIHSVVKELSNNISKESCVIHTSGSAELEEIATTFKNCGVLYPLYPFAEGCKIDFKEVKILIESSGDTTDEILSKLISKKNITPIKISSKERLQIHIAAIFACNFTNHLVSTSQKYLEMFGYDLKIIQPLLERCFSNILQCSGGVSSLQTGPAVREDYQVISKHLEILKADESMYKIYENITKSIIAEKDGNKKL